MGDILGESDVARLLKISESTVRRLFEKGVLTGTRSGGDWQTNEDLLRGDIDILTEVSRIDRLREGSYVSPSPDGLSEDGPHEISSERISEILNDEGVAQRSY